MKERQRKIIQYLVKEYIKNGQPVSSKKLFEKVDFKISSATLRIEMHYLRTRGYLVKTHPFSGSIPTPKAYRFFLENFCYPKLSLSIQKELEEVFEEKEKRKLLENLVEKIAFFSKSLAFIYWEKTLFWEGLSNFFSIPEFWEPRMMLRAVRFLEKIFKGIQTIVPPEEFEIYFGKKLPLGRCPDLSLIFGKLANGMVGILGPLRMDYQKNIALLKKTKELLEKSL